MTLLSLFNYSFVKQEIGRVLPEWSLESALDEEVPALADFRGKPVLLLFFSLRCPNCFRNAIPHANQLLAKWGEQLPVLGIHTFFEGGDFRQEQYEEAREILDIRFPFYKDDTLNRTIKDFQVEGTPYWMLIDNEGRVADTIPGDCPDKACTQLALAIEKITEV